MHPPRCKRCGDVDKALHHTISSGAALLNWHASMRDEALS